ncbi:MAG: phosphatidylserine decarboxylase family protein [Smithellaceae bacterium]|nr:phosphatidylserine decarboxylase family protein [Smithellaceae bacterium]
MNHESYIVREGLPFILISLTITFIFAVFELFWLTIFFSLVTIFVVAFFRNPQRESPQDEGSVVSPADGKIIKIDNVTESGLIRGEFMMISIFMNVFNVHVNRIPCAGKIWAIDYKEGKFLRADLDKASIHNERNYLVIRTGRNEEIMFVQIAGLIARRIVCWVKTGMAVKKGERFGLIRFGSRVDIYLPHGIDIQVELGQKVRAGETVLGVRK